jgi:hypothetical protein
MVEGGVSRGPSFGGQAGELFFGVPITEFIPSDLARRMISTFL